jgi:Papain-like cysteine protease AvrRpt2
MHEHLDVPYHQQDTDFYCGAACAQMVLHAIGQPLLSQDDLYNDNHNHTVEASDWSTPPDGLCWTMNNRQSLKHFTLDSTDSEDPISRTICWAIHQYQCAPIALVFGGNHWAVVRGYTASAAPASAFDTSYTIASFDLNNPWPPVPGPPGPPPHTDGDACGGGGNRGVADINVSYSTWQSDYLTPNGFGTQWLGRYVAVCDPDPPGSPPPPSPPPVPDASSTADGQRLLEAPQVRAGLLGNLQKAGLLSHPIWSKVFDQVRTAEPLQVQRLDRQDSYYWIVPTVDAQGKLRAVVGVDGRMGGYQQAMAVNNPDASMFGFADSAKATARVAGQQFALPGGAGQLLVRPQEVSVQAALVWRPCRESLSPFYPFRVLSVGAHRLYVRVFDGAVFTALSSDLGGL